MALSRQQLEEFARHGAATRIAQLQAEIASIRRAFGAGVTAAVDELKRGFGGRRGRKPGPKPGRNNSKISAAGRAAISAAQKARWAKKKSGGRKRKGMNAAQKAAVSRRMKAYWAKRRAEKAKAGKK